MSNVTHLTHVITQTITLTTTTPGLTIAVNMPPGAAAVELQGTGASTPTWQLCPRLRKAWWFDDSAGAYTDITKALTDRTTTSAINSFEGAADPYKDFIYLGCDVPFRGAYVDVTNTNGTASVLNALYPTAQDTWAGLTETDGTASAGACLAQDAPITWTVPSDWVKTIENGSGPFFWVRFGVTVTLDATVSLAAAVPLSVQTNRASLAASTVFPKPRYWFDRQEVGGIEATGDNTDTMIIDWLCNSKNMTLAAE